MILFMKYMTDVTQLQLNPAFEKALFFDIETTGFSKESCMIYLIGAGTYEKGAYTIHQWFASSPADEAEIISAFLLFAKNYDTWVHFNGDLFDLPFLSARCEKYGLEKRNPTISSIDLYKRIFPYRKVLKLLNVKQKSVELFLDIHREDTYHGGELIPMYYEYTKNPDEDILRVLLLHNYEDMEGLAKISFIDNYRLLLEGADGVHIHSCKMEKSGELILAAELPFLLPKAISLGTPDYYLTGFMKSLKLGIHTFSGELKYFYKDYKNYYYLPAEDLAIHKSVAAYMDKNYRVKATADNCYTKKNGVFLPQEEALFTPCFVTGRKAHKSYFEYSEDFLNHRENQLLYLRKILTWQKGLAG